MKRLQLIMFLWILSFSVMGAERDSLEIEILKMRIEKLEEYKDLRDEKFDDQLELLIEKNKLNIEIAKQDIRNEVVPIKWAVGAVSLILALSIGAFLYQMFVGIKREAERQLRKNLKNQLKENSDVLLSLISSQKLEERMKSDAKIVILSASKKSALNIEQLLVKMEFKNFDSKIIDKYETLDQADLIVFNNFAKDFNEDIIFEYLRQSSEGTLFVCFYPEYMKVPIELSDKVNFANKPYTLYHQIIQTLSFQKLFKVE